MLDEQEDDSHTNYEDIDRIQVENAQNEAEVIQQTQQNEGNNKQQEKKNSDSEWVLRSRPGSRSKPGANLKTAKTGINEEVCILGFDRIVIL